MPSLRDIRVVYEEYVIIIRQLIALGIILLSAPGWAAPDIVVLMVDDLDRRSLQELLDAGLMPEFQSLFAERGVQFSDSFVTTPVCCPSRATYLTGQYAHNHGVTVNYTLYDVHDAAPRGVTVTEDGPISIPVQAGRLLGGAVGLLNDADTLATRLSSGGYATIHVGKYLNGYGQLPDYADVSPAFVPEYVPPGWTQWHGLIDPGTYCVYDYAINHNGIVREYRLPPGVEQDSALYQTHVLADVAAEAIQTHLDDGSPLFISLMPLAPHAEVCSQAYPDGEGGGGLGDSYSKRIRPAPEDVGTPMPMFVPGPAFFEDNADKPGWLKALPPKTANDYVDIVEQHASRLRSMLPVDRLIGRVAQALGPQRSAEAVWVFVSDNGWFYGEYRRSGKRLAYDAAARVPTYIVHPDAAAPRTSTQFVLNNDLAPTLLDMAGIAFVPEDFDGRSFAALLEVAGAEPWTPRVRFAIEHRRSLPLGIGDTPPSFAAWRSRSQLYIETDSSSLNGGGTERLIGLEYYDLLADPLTLDSLLQLPQNEPPPPFHRLLQRLRSCGGAQCRNLETFENSEISN
jgi:N-acetylglucosamine-6-sulfatase